MFKFLKNKLKNSISNISKKIDEEGEVVEEISEEPKQGLFSKIKEKFSKQDIDEEELKKEGFEEVDLDKEKKEDVVKEEKKEVEEKIKEKVEKGEAPKLQELNERKELEKEEQSLEEEKEKKGFFSKIKEKVTTKKINEKQFEDLFWDLEMILLENNVAVEVIEKIKEDLKNELVEKPLFRSKLESIIQDTLKKSLTDILTIEKLDFFDKIKSKKPFVICFVGINGSGKTTTIAKVANMLKKNKLSCVLAASDTFRAASIEQLQKHADKLGVKLIKHDYGSDPAAVAYDAIQHAKSKGIDVVLIDTAGRLHSNVNLLAEMKKIIRVAKPDMKIFVGEAITGNDCVEQAKEFNNAIGIDAIILSKADIDEKGGASISVSYVTKKPIVYIGVGQEYSDLKDFDASVVVESLGLA